MPRCAWKCVRAAVSGGVYFQGPWVSFVTTDELSQSLLQELVSHELTVYLSVFDLFLTHEMAILLKRLKPNSFESHSSLNISFTKV